jgi:hypothetical protein
MSSAGTIKTTVRLPADLHWSFQGERAKRRLSNEKAIYEAFSDWIAGRPQNSLRPSQSTRSRQPVGLPATPDERKWVQILLDILRDSANPVHASLMKSVLETLAAGICTTGSQDFEKKGEQVHKGPKIKGRGKPE